MKILPPLDGSEASLAAVRHAIGLVQDGLRAAERAERGIMRRPPCPPTEILFAHGLWQHVLGVGLLIGGLCLAVQAWALSTEGAHW